MLSFSPDQADGCQDEAYLVSRFRGNVITIPTTIIQDNSTITYEKFETFLNLFEYPGLPMWQRIHKFSSNSFVKTKTQTTT